MRRLGTGLACVMLAAACSRAPDSSGPGESVSNARGIAFTYAYQLRLPSDAISDLQDQHARACERLAARCRITGLGYHVDDTGIVSAELSLALAAPIARAFGREAVGGAEALGGSLVGAEIVGGDAVSTKEANVEAAERGRDEVGRINRELARSDLADSERAELRRQRATAAAQRTDATTAGTAAATDLATTSVSFRYTAGRGVGLRATLADAAQTGLGSLTTTLSILLRTIAILGPPAVLLAAGVLLWRRWLRRWWWRAFGVRDQAAGLP